MSYSKGEQVTWAWGDGRAEGKIKDVYTSKISKTIKGTEVTRNASDDEPAFLIEQEDGSEVLKSASELD